MDKIFYLIQVNNVEELSEVVFNKKLSSDSFKGYASCLSCAEEKYLVEKFLTTKDKVWSDFIRKYIEHFPLSDEAVQLLLENTDNSEIKELLLEEWKKYGANEKESFAFCDKLHKQDELDEELLTVFCDSAHLAYYDVIYKLSLIDNKWSERYVNASKRYMKNVR